MPGENPFWTCPLTGQDPSGDAGYELIPFGAMYFLLRVAICIAGIKSTPKDRSAFSNFQLKLV